MSATTTSNDALKQLAQHLSSQLGLKDRRGTFDMDDRPETDVLTSFPDLKASLDWLDSSLGEKWRKADKEALRCQRNHRRLARIAIVTGTAAIVLAVAQLAIKLTVATTYIAAALELGAVGAAVISVAVGFIAKYDRRWLAQRHLAERLRMLKFSSLEQLWCLEPAKWQEWVTARITVLEGLEDAKTVKHEIEEWSRKDLIEPQLATSLVSEPEPTLLNAVTTYYRFKRVEFQAEYFDRRQKDFKKATGGWLHLSLPLFLISVACVIGHFLLEHFGPRAEDEGVRHLLEQTAIWLVASAAIIPVLGLGIRAWFAAFELPRSAILFAAKHQALRNLVHQVEEDSGRALPTVHHMAQTEHFLEHEHREWLRLLSETEWFL
jgi:hypothetical protein